MAVKGSGRRGRRGATWSTFGDLGRRPSDYEIVTHGMNHTLGDIPLEMGPEVHGNVWLKKYRDGMALHVPDWEGVRDPDQMHYSGYVKLQDEQEAYVDNLLIAYTEQKNIDAGLSAPALNFLGHVLAPGRYLVHGQQMILAYLHQLAPSSFISNALVFITADQLRRVQRIAYRTKQLDNAHPGHCFGSKEREIWEHSPNWQPMRQAVEKMLVTFAWDEAFVAACLVVNPICDRLLLWHLSRTARALDDDLDALIAEALYRDSERQFRFSSALSQYVIAADAANRETLCGFVETWQESAEAMITAGSSLVCQHAEDMIAGEVAADVRQFLTQFHADAGLGHVG